LASGYRIIRLKSGEPRPDFDCGDPDLNEYFKVDSIAASKELIAVTYALYQGEKAIAYYCVSNDAIRRDLTSNTMFKKIRKLISSPDKRYPSMPAVKIGRFAVDKDVRGTGIGTSLMSGIKYDFTNGNKTGCRFIIVDAYNRPDTTKFYEKNGFSYLSSVDAGKTTRLMYYDLIQFSQPNA